MMYKNLHSSLPLSYSVGIDSRGVVGALQRDGQSNVSNACGAAVGAYKALMSKAASSDKPPVKQLGDDKDTDLFDPQLNTIVGLLEARLAGIDNSIDLPHSCQHSSFQ